MSAPSPRRPQTFDETPEQAIARHVRATAADPVLDAHRRDREAQVLEGAGRELAEEFTGRDDVSLRQVLGRLDEIAEAHRQGVTA